MIEPRVTSSYEHRLQAIYYEIGNRGIRVNAAKLKDARAFVSAELNRNLGIASNQWGVRLYVGDANNPNAGLKKSDTSRIEAYNLNSSSGEFSVLKLLTRLGYTVPKISVRNAEGEYEGKYSTNELALQRILRDNQFNYPNGDPAIKAILSVRELSKLSNSYINSRLYKSVDGECFFLSGYNVAGTLTGRRASRKHTFNFGNNGQNLPKHGATAKVFKECLVARKGCIFISVDQKSAEEWPVSALAENYEAIKQMQTGVNRHIKRAVFIFSIPEHARTESQWKDSIEYYLGKKTGHANNYGMKKDRMSQSLIQEGHWFSVDYCGVCLDRLNALEPNTKGVFHKYVQDTLYNCGILTTPFGRERQFMGIRPDDYNTKLFNEAFAYIPQSTVGDNNGFAVAHISTSGLPLSNRFIIQESHDSVIQDVPDNLDVMWKCLDNTIAAYDRTITFHNGIRVQIPVEAEIGYDLHNMVKVKDLSYDGLKQAREILQAKMHGQASVIQELDFKLQ